MTGRAIPKLDRAFASEPQASAAALAFSKLVTRASKTLTAGPAGGLLSSLRRLSAALQALGEIVGDLAPLAEDRDALELARLVVGYHLQRRRTRHLLSPALGLPDGTPSWPTPAILPEVAATASSGFETICFQVFNASTRMPMCRLPALDHTQDLKRFTAPYSRLPPELEVLQLAKLNSARCSLHLRRDG